MSDLGEAVETLAVDYEEVVNDYCHVCVGCNKLLNESKFSKRQLKHLSRNQGPRCEICTQTQLPKAQLRPGPKIKGKGKAKGGGKGTTVIKNVRLSAAPRTPPVALASSNPFNVAPPPVALASSNPFNMAPTQGLSKSQPASIENRFAVIKQFSQMFFPDMIPDHN